MNIVKNQGVRVNSACGRLEVDSKDCLWMPPMLSADICFSCTVFTYMFPLLNIFFPFAFYFPYIFPFFLFYFTYPLFLFLFFIFPWSPIASANNLSRATFFLKTMNIPVPLLSRDEKPSRTYPVEETWEGNGRLNPARWWALSPSQCLVPQCGSHRRSARSPCFPGWIWNEYYKIISNAMQLKTTNLSKTSVKFKVK